MLTPITIIFCLGLRLQQELSNYRAGIRAEVVSAQSLGSAADTGRPLGCCTGGLSISSKKGLASATAVHRPGMMGVKPSTLLWEVLRVELKHIPLVPGIHPIPAPQAPGTLRPCPPVGFESVLCQLQIAIIFSIPHLA